MSFPYGEIERKLGYAFRKKTLLDEAFTHATYVHRHGGKDNDRLEYLGDAVLGAVIAEMQYGRGDKATAGQMTQERAKLVCKSALDSATDGLGVWQYLRYEGTRENLRGKPKSSLFEAIVGAIFLDGGYDCAKAFIHAHGVLKAPAKKENSIGDLQEFLQARGEPLPNYGKPLKTGKDHAPIFRCSVTAMGESAEGEGKNIAEAKQLAASRLLFELKKKYEKE
jgi:ribonuclease-3